MKIEELKIDMFKDLIKRIKSLSKIEINDILTNIEEILRKDDIDIENKEIIYTITTYLLKISKDLNLEKEKDLEQLSDDVFDIYASHNNEVDEKILSSMLGWILSNLTKVLNTIEKEKDQKMKLKKNESNAINMINNTLDSSYISNNLKMLVVQHNLQFINKPIYIKLTGDARRPGFNIATSETEDNDDEK